MHRFRMIKLRQTEKEMNTNRERERERGRVKSGGYFDVFRWGFKLVH